jgi:hypothetical protein
LMSSGGLLPMAMASILMSASVSRGPNRPLAEC